MSKPARDNHIGKHGPVGASPPAIADDNIAALLLPRCAVDWRVPGAAAACFSVLPVRRIRVTLVTCTPAIVKRSVINYVTLKFCESYSVSVRVKEFPLQILFD